MKKFKDIVVIGVALFAMFFGAGNLIFPPQLGVLSGDSWLQAIMGFFTTDVSLSILAIIAIAKSGGTFNSFASKVGPKFSIVMGIIIMLIIGPLLALPRTGAVSYEMGILPIFPGIPQYIFTLVYFGISLLFVINPKGIIDKIAVYLTPILLIALVSIIVKNILMPDNIMPAAKLTNVYTYAFLEGYQTLDGLAAVIFAGIILMGLKEKGYTDTSSQIKMTIKSGLVAFSIIGFVYGGLIYLGANGASSIPEGMSRTETFMALVDRMFGQYGLWMVAVTVIFACFTTTVGLTTTVAEYFSELSNNKLSYRFNVVTITLVSFVLANLGVEQIVYFSGPILGIIYPAILVLIVLNLFDKYITYKGIYSGVVGGTLGFSTLMFICKSFDSLSAAKDWLSSFPMSTYEMGWLIPAIFGGLIATAFYKIKTVR
ncbi:branched-chain amino acid transport system II carrier protein [Ancylomarina euxinus]|uniref:Branched-chain amino acid transport system II carrier protein n=1 Tax=Ancylomarina euxinus TaxID=2283627 RepID=A0A425Y1Y3_9BACT|nr:branched-chain amino acid transport system II carrier protein [Ancylomarina euxinus]MCZ4695050.1 branched-chain amino acid transport system II carrier protein [Ancylomarina euxinus]MUP15014.1 branched-chain amino acid transport system II carrier protein [Ancylomarina euxinus]RRG21902.1 branched-chain amino acid transport system II carrier protein [Ancylomarina euxinus]